MDEKVKDLEIVLNWKALVLVVIAGVCITLLLGFAESPEVLVRHYTRYGYPLVWRVVPDFSPEEYNVTYLFADFIFWIATVFMFVAISDGISRKIR